MATFKISKEEYLEPDEDLRRAIRTEELLVSIEADGREAYRKRHNA